MIGPLEIVIVVVILLLIFGYRKLPELGRSAGKGARSAGKSAKELTDSVGERVGDKVDPASIGRSAGKGLREARELRDSFTGTSEARSTGEPKRAGEVEPDRSEPPADGERHRDA